MNKEKDIYPVIINKYLALKKISSRKEADRLLKAGKIKVNGKLAEPGQMISSADEVEVEINKNFIYLAYHKPKGIITHSPQGKEKSIADIFKAKEKVFPLGRLDKASSGLIILTNDGRITERLLSPDVWHEKEYEVAVNKKIDEKMLNQLARGVRLDDGYQTRPCQVRKQGEKKFSIILTEGKKHQIRRMCQALGYHVDELKRVRIVNIRLGDIKIGGSREIKGQELEKFLGLVGLHKPLPKGV
ncbi:rRNA pseudouridine synthase [Candidatus Falkowbacteria bacterium]|nr:rRNA pseudouridine synthase [Candidatus Falkowbacteria bacterium]